MCIWGCHDNKVCKERFLSWKSKLKKPIYLNLLHNNVKVDDDDDNDEVDENLDGEFDDADLIRIMEDEMHKGHLMAEHNHSMLSICQEGLHCACSDAFTNDLNDLISSIFTSSQIGGSKANETHPIEIINFIMANPVDLTTPHHHHAPVIDIHNYVDWIAKFLDSKTSTSKSSSYLSMKAVLSALMTTPLLREKFDMMTQLLQGGLPVLIHPAIAEPNKHLILTPPSTLSYMSFFNIINNNNRVYELMETAIKVIYMPSSISVFTCNGFLGKSTYRCAVSFVSSIAALGNNEREVVVERIRKVYEDAHHTWFGEDEEDVSNHDVDFFVPLILILHGGIIDQVVRPRFPHIDDSSFSDENICIIGSILELLNTLLETNENLKRQLLSTQGTFIAKTLMNVLELSSNNEPINDIIVLAIRLAINLSSSNEFRVYFGQQGFPFSISLFAKSTVIVEKILRFEIVSLSSDALGLMFLSRAKASQYSKDLLLMIDYSDMVLYYDEQRRKCCNSARNLSLMSATYINRANDGCQLNVMLYPEIFKYLQSNLMRLTPSLISADIISFHVGVARQACILLQTIAYRNVNGQKLVIETGCIGGLIDCLNEVSGSDYCGSQELRTSIIDCVEKLVTYSNPLLLEMIQRSCGVLGLLQLMYNGSSHIRIGIITSLLEKCSKYPKFYDEIIKFDGIRMIYGILGANDFLVQANALRLLKMLLIKKEARLASMAKANINALSALLNSKDLQVKRNAVECLGILSSDDSNQEMHTILRNNDNNGNIVDKIRNISSESFPYSRSKILPTLDIDHFESEKMVSSQSKNSLLFNSPNRDMFNNTKAKSSSSVSVISDAEREFRSTNLTAANVLAQFSDTEETIWPDGNPDIYKNILKLGSYPKIEQ